MPDTMNGQTHARICTVPGCGRPTEARGWCAKHYMRWRTTGSVDLAQDAAPMRDINQNADLPPRKMHGPYKTDPFGAKIYGTSDKGGDCTVLDIRGWGYLTGRGQGALGMDDHPAMVEQQRFAEFVVAALNAAEDASK